MFFKKKKKEITLECGKEVRWPSGLCLQATEESVFLLPGAIFKNGVPMGSIMESSDPEMSIIVDEESVDQSLPDEYPNMFVVIKPGETLKLNKSCYPIHIHFSDQEKKPKKFIVVAGKF